MKITHELIESITKKDGQYFFPQWINIAIERNIECDNIDDITKEYLDNLFAVFQEYKKKLEPVPIRYPSSLTLDAYTAFYYGRNFCIPLIGLRDLAYHPLFQNIPSEIRVLDIGSGTGAIVLGLLWMFSQKPLSATTVHITAVDSCEEALDRQSKIIEEAGFKLDNVKLHTVNISNIENCIETIEEYGPFNIIFSGNCLTEIPEQDVYNIVQRLPELLVEEGAIIIAEAQRDYSKMLIRKLVAFAPQWGLHVYYPCTGGEHPYIGEYKNYCMVWRDHGCKVPEIKVNGSPLAGHRNDTLTACWLILTKKDISIYDVCRHEGLGLKWGPISLAYNQHRAICSGDQRFDLSDDGEFHLYKRGHIVGLSDENKVVVHHKI